MEKDKKISLETLSQKGIRVPGIPEKPPIRDGHILFAVITTAEGAKFTVAVDEPIVYGGYRTQTNHSGDQGSWLFKKMALYFVPENCITMG
jgi:hypothetical protein